MLEVDALGPDLDDAPLLPLDWRFDTARRESGPAWQGCFARHNSPRHRTTR